MADIMNDLARAKALLRDNDYTFAAACGDKTISSCKRGVKPLLTLLDNGDNLCGYCAADKVIGKGAAFLYLLLGVCAVYADVISEPALNVLQGGEISVEYSDKVEYIFNRKGNGMCPIEQAVADIANASAALPVIRQTLKNLQLNNKSDKNA